MNESEKWMNRKRGIKKTFDHRNEWLSEVIDQRFMAKKKK